MNVLKRPSQRMVLVADLMRVARDNGKYIIEEITS
jgi:hypothetical protein